MHNRRILFELSNGGADATVVREFDLHDREFVSESDNGFIIHEAKQRVYWKDSNTLLVGTDMKAFGMDTVTNSGYPRVVYQWRRGTKLTDAKVVFEGDKTDVAVMSYVAKHRNYRVIIRYRSLTFYTSKKTVKVLGYYNNKKPSASSSDDDDEAGWKDVPIPADAQVPFIPHLLYPYHTFITHHPHNGSFLSRNDLFPWTVSSLRWVCSPINC